MYSYVGNDPVNRVDPDGQFWGALFKFVIGLFKSVKPNVINGSFTYRNVPPISVSFANFQNIGVAFAGIGFNLRSGGNWLPAVLGVSESADPPDNIEFLPDDSSRSSYGSSKESLIRSIVQSLMSDACTAIFHKAGLVSPKEILEKGVVIGPISLLLDRSNLRLLGITEAAFNRDSKNADAARAVTIRDKPGFAPETVDGRPRILLGPSAFNNLRYILKHEFIHAGGGLAKYNPFGSDLSWLGYETRTRWMGGGKWLIHETVKVGVTEDDIVGACR